MVESKVLIDGDVVRNQDGAIITLSEKYMDNEPFRYWLSRYCEYVTITDELLSQMFNVDNNKWIVSDTVAITKNKDGYTINYYSAFNVKFMHELRRLIGLAGIEIKDIKHSVL